jgi:hypothetical protein
MNYLWTFVLAMISAGIGAFIPFYAVVHLRARWLILIVALMVPFGIIWGMLFDHLSTHLRLIILGDSPIYAVGVSLGILFGSIIGLRRSK